MADFEQMTDDEIDAILSDAISTEAAAEESELDWSAYDAQVAKNAEDREREAIIRKEKEKMAGLRGLLQGSDYKDLSDVSPYADAKSESATKILEEHYKATLPDEYHEGDPRTDPVARQAALAADAGVVSPFAGIGTEKYMKGLKDDADAARDKYLSGIDQQIYRQGRIARALGQLGDKEAELLGLKEDYGAGFPETLSEAKARIHQQWVTDRQNYQERFDENMAEANLMAQYPGASIDQIKLWKRQLRLDEERRPGSMIKDMSRGAVDRMLAKKAAAMRNLAKAQEIDPNRAFGGVTSQVLAGLAVGLGAWASSRSGRPNTALDLYKHAIANDISAQKEKFAHARGQPGRLRGEYAFWMNRYNSDRVATLGTAVAKYGAAANGIQQQIAKLKGGIERDKALGIQGQLLSQKNKLEAALAKAAFEEEQAQHSGIMGLDGKQIRYTGPRGKDRTPANKTVHNALVDTRVKSGKAIDALKQYKSAWDRSKMILGTDEKAQVDAALQALVARLGDVWDKGVLQEFEWEQLLKMLPGSKNAFWERSTFNRTEAVLKELENSFRGAFEAHANALSDYHLSGSSGFGKGTTSGEKGSTGAVATDSGDRKAAVANLLKGREGKGMVLDHDEWSTRNERGVDIFRPEGYTPEPEKTK